MANESMPTEANAPRKIHRVRIGANFIVQIGLILFLAAMVNYLGFQHYKRWDLSRDKKYALSDKSRRFLETVKGKLRLTVFFDPNQAIYQDVQNLLTEYQYAARNKIDVEFIDPTRSLSRAKELFDKYKVVSDESLIVVEYQTGATRRSKPPRWRRLIRATRCSAKGRACRHSKASRR